MKIKYLSIITVLLAVTILTGACASAQVTESPQVPSPAPTEIPPTSAPTSEPEPEQIVIIDDLGIEIVLEGPAQKIISISPSLTEILFSVGAGDKRGNSGK